MLSGFDLVSSWDSDWHVQMANNSEHIYTDSTYLQISLDKMTVHILCCLFVTELLHLWGMRSQRRLLDLGPGLNSFYTVSSASLWSIS